MESSDSTRVEIALHCWNGYKDFDEELGLRDLLALDRTILANERTVLAYARTSVMLLVSSITLLKIFPDNRLAFFTGIALIPVAMIVAAVGLRRFLGLSRSLLKRRSRSNGV